MKDLGSVPFMGLDGVRVIEHDGKPWFVAADACKILGISNYRGALRRLSPDEKGRSSYDRPGGRQDVLILSEGGLWTVVLRSREALKPGTVAFNFRKWVTATLIPEARERLGYQLVPPGYRVRKKYTRKPSLTEFDSPLEDPEHELLAVYFAEKNRWSLRQTRQLVASDLKRRPDDLVRMRELAARART